MRLDYYFTKSIMSKHRGQELFSVSLFVINKFTTYTRYWDDRSGPAEQFLKRGGQWPPLLNLRARGRGAGVDSYYIKFYFTTMVTKSKYQQGKFVCSLFVAASICQITKPFLSCQQGPFSCCTWWHMQDSPAEVCRSWSSEVPVIPSFCLECRRNK